MSWLRNVGCSVAVALFVVVAVAEAAPTVTLGCDLAPTLKGAVRYRNLSNQASGPGAKEIFTGASPLTTHSDGDVTWSTGKSITFSYDGATLSTTVPSSTPSPVTRSVGDLGALNYLEITITKNTSMSAINFNSVELGGDSLGNFQRPSGTMGPLCWRVTGIDLTAGFSLTGTLALTPSFGGGDSSFVQIDVGFVTPPDTEGPVTSNVYVTPDPVLLNGQATVKATVNDSTTGGSTIASAEYNVNDTGWVAMAAKDSLFDSVEEDVEATFTGSTLGANQVCVRGTDALGNVGEPTCQYFLVTYKFDGFFSPIDNGITNVAKGGQAVPVKWRLTDANDVPISDPASFVGLFTSVNLCSGGEPTDAVEEYASGSSGLQYIGDGYWQFNWKTPKTYAHTCQAMYVEFNSGATSPVVKFQFKK